MDETVIKGPSDEDANCFSSEVSFTVKSFVPLVLRKEILLQVCSWKQVTLYAKDLHI